MKFSYEWLKDLSGVTLSAEAIATLLTDKACEVEVSGDGVLEADILPNRPDLLSHIGLAREVSALVKGAFSEPGAALLLGTDGVPVRIEDKESCLRYTGLMVRGVTVGPSPDWLRERLELLGIQSINNIVDVANYVMLETGQPLHAFDHAKLRGAVRVRHAKKGERIRTLDEGHTEVELDPSILVITDDSGPIAIAGIKGGADTAVTDGTHDIFLEAAIFSPSVIRAGTTKLNMRTDASTRFSYGVASYLTPVALARAAEMLTKVAGGIPDKMAVDVYPRPTHPQQLMLNAEYVRSLLGADIRDNRIVEILSALGFAVHANGSAMTVSVPHWRLDVERQEDLIEEVGRVYGYNEIPSSAPIVHAYDERSWIREDEDVEWDEYGYIREREAIVRMLAARGYTEVYNYSLVSDELKALLTLDEMLELAVPQSAQYRWLRTSTLPRLLLNARDNLRFTKTVRLMETGHVYDHVGQGSESTRLGLILARAGKSDDVFYELKGAVDALTRELGITDMLYDDVAPFSADTAAQNMTIAGRQANFKDTEGNTIGFIGQVQPRIAAALKLKGTAVVAELDLRALVRHAQQEREYAPLPKYPAMERDISMLVADDVRVRQVYETIRGADSDGLVDDIDVIDIFVPTGKEKLEPDNDRHAYGKSVAVRVVYRSDDRTLTDAEVAVAEEAIKSALQEQLQAQIR